MRVVKFIPTIALLGLIVACSNDSDFAKCSSASVGEPDARMGAMNKCMLEKGYHLNGVAGTNDSFTESKWVKSN